MQKIHSLMLRLENQDLSKLFIRLALGIVFVHAGYLKLLDMNMVVTGFATIGFPAFLAYFVSYAEFIGGILLILGVFSRYIAVILGIIMAVAFFKAHLPNGFGLQNGGYEYVLVLFLLCLGVITAGPGKYSVWRFWKRAFAK